MNSLEKAIEKKLSELPPLFLAPLIRSKLKAQGVRITARRARSMARQALGGRKTFSIAGEHTGPLDITLSASDTAGLLAKMDSFLENDLPEILLKTQVESAPIILKSLKKRWPAEQRLQRRELVGFRHRLHQRWSRGITS